MRLLCLRYVTFIKSILVQYFLYTYSVDLQNGFKIDENEIVY